MHICMYACMHRAKEPQVVCHTLYAGRMCMEGVQDKGTVQDRKEGAEGQRDRGAGGRVSDRTGNTMMTHLVGVGQLAYVFFSTSGICYVDIPLCPL
jgi:hypothetical protein